MFKTIAVTGLLLALFSEAKADNVTYTYQVVGMFNGQPTGNGAQFTETLPGFSNDITWPYAPNALSSSCTGTVPEPVSPYCYQAEISSQPDGSVLASMGFELDRPDAHLQDNWTYPYHFYGANLNSFGTWTASAGGFNFTLSVTEAPEPATFGLFAICALILPVCAKQKKWVRGQMNKNPHP